MPPTVRRVVVGRRCRRRYPRSHWSGEQSIDGYVDRRDGGITELRVHGVSGTPPQSMLENPNVTRVAGDDNSGFYRRVWLGGRPGPAVPYADRPGRRREAYSWGGLTSGAASRALWLLLLPFMLANVAFWMYPAPTPTEPPRWWDWVRDAGALLQRLFALTLTLVFTLALVEVTTDVTGWQCANTAACYDQHGFLRYPATHLTVTGVLAVVSLIPVAAVLLLWRLGATTWNTYEQLGTVGDTDETDPFATPIGSRKMWNGAEPVRRLRALHVTVALAATGLFPLAPLATADTGSPGRLAARLLAGALVVLAGYCLLMLVRPEPFRRPPTGATRTGRSRDSWFWLPRVALLLVAAALLTCGVAGLPATEATGALPWLHQTVVVLVPVQVGLLALVLSAVAVVALASRGDQPAEDGLPGRALGGLGTPVLLALSAIVGDGLAAGLTLRVADYLGTPAPVGATGSTSTTLLPAPYFWTAAVALAVVAALVVLLPVGYLVAARQSRQRAWRDVRATYPAEAIAQRPARARAVVHSWAAARLTDRAGGLLGLAVAVLGVVGGAAVGTYLGLGGSWIWVHASWLTTAGSWTVAAMIGGLLALARSAYRDPRLRRTVGIVWDLGTFWPRATHPLAPPCYCERSVPDLVARINWLAPKPPQDLVVLSTHSQGTVIGAALVLQLTPAQRRRVALVTYGSPLQRLYCGFFPAYFNPSMFERLGQALAASAAAPETAWPWRNLYRGSDPIGGPVRHAYTADALLYTDPAVAALPAPAGTFPGDNAGVDRALLDPLFTPAPGDASYPLTHGHSDYFADPYFTTTIERVIDLARQRQSPE